MMSTRRPRRILTAVASATAMAILVGCGGSAVEQPTAQGDLSGAQTEANTTTDSGSGSALPTDSTDTPTGGAQTTGSTVTQAQGDKAGGGGTATQGAGKGPKANAETKGGTTGSGGTAVEKLIASSAIFGGTGVCKPATLSEVNIGNVSTLSGILGELFAPVTPALETFVASQNACGGLNGHKIKFFQLDDQGDPATAASKATEMIQKNKVLAFVGNIQVLTVDAAMPVYKKFGVPVIGSDNASNSWFTSPMAFPQGPGSQSIAYGYLVGATQYHKVTNVGNLWCIEVPRACEQIDRAFRELAPKFGATVKKTIQISITTPSYVQQCLEFKNAGVQAIAMTVDAATQVRFARSCEQVGWFPKVVPYPLSVGNEKQFFGNKWLGNAYVPMNHFPWMDDSTPATKYYQAAVRKYNPGFESGGAAALGWGAGALLVAASAGLSPTNPTTQQFLDTLWTFKGQKWTTLGGLTAPLTYNKDGFPKIPYCLFGAITNDANNGWKQVISKPTCTDITAPSDPQNQA